MTGMHGANSWLLTATAAGSRSTTACWWMDGNEIVGGVGEGASFALTFYTCGGMRLKTTPSASPGPRDSLRAAERFRQKSS